MKKKVEETKSKRRADCGSGDVSWRGRKEQELEES
jgi:hypothetical protein